MKSILISMVLLAAFSTHAYQQEGYVQNTVQDDEGLKVVLSDTIDHARSAKKVKTLYVLNTQPDFEQLKQLFENSKSMKSKVIINKDQMKAISAKMAGK